MPIHFIFRWSGEPLGYVHAGVLYDFADQCLGWVERDGSVWGVDGHYLGELVEEAYVLRNTTRLPPLQRAGRFPPLNPPQPTQRPEPRIPRAPRAHWIDGL